MSTEHQRTCPSCGNEFSGAMEFCPVCMLRKGLTGGVESGESSFEKAVKPTPDQPAQRFEYYALEALPTRARVQVFQFSQSPAKVKRASVFHGDRERQLRFRRFAPFVESVRA